MKRIESFKSFSEIKTQLREEAKQKEMASKREASTAAFNELLSKYGAASVKDLNEDDMASFMEELREGNAFSAARAKAIADGKKEFTVDGETYPVEDVDAEDKENAEEFVEESAVNEARIQIDVIDPTNKYLINTVKKLGLGMNIITWNGPGGGNPEVEFTGKRKDIDTLLDKHFGSKRDFEDFIEESVVNESEAENILQDLLDERGGDMGELHGMSMEDALDTVETYGHKGSKAKKIAKELFSMCNESVEAVNEGTRGQVGIIDKNGNIQSIYTHYDSYPEYVLPVLKKYYKDAKSVEKIVAKGDSRGIDKPTDMEFYGDNRPNSTGKIGNIDKYIKDIRDNGGAEYLYLYDETDKTWYMANVRSDSRSKELVPAFESVNLNENYEVIYSDGVSAMKKFRSEAKALDFMKKTIASNKKLRDIAVYRPGMYSTTQTELVVSFWGNGSYLDNVSKKDPKLAAKKLEESANEEVEVDINFETVEERNAFIFAAAKAKKEGKKRFTFNGKTFPVTLKVDLLK